MSRSLNSIQEALREAAAIRLAPPTAAEAGQAETIATRALDKVFALRKLDHAREAAGFRALPLPQYLTRLARNAGVDHLLPKAPAKPAELAPWVRMAREIEADVAAIGLWVRGWFATFAVEKSSFGALLAAREHARTTGTGLFPEDLTPDAFCAALAEIEASYTEQQKKELAACLTI